VEEEEAHTETLICFFRYSSYFPPRLPRTTVAAFFRRSLLLLLLPFFFHFSFSLTRYASPRPTATLPTFQPLEQQLIFIAMSPPPSAPIPNLLLSPHPRPRPMLVLEFFLSVLLLRSFVSFLSFFLSFLPRRSHCPWSVISRRGGDENARLGLRAVVSSFCGRLPPSFASFSYSIRFHSFLAYFFFRSTPFLFFVHACCDRAIRKSIDCEQRAVERSHCHDILRIFTELMARSLSMRRSHDRLAIPQQYPRYTLTREQTL